MCEMKFVLSINLGNEAMMDPPDVAQALLDIAKILSRDGGDAMEHGVVRDANGNTVGEWNTK
jgi:hypothetical protein